jgi:hypothetical protein
MVKGISVSLSTLAHTIVRQLTHVPRTYTCRVNIKLILKTSLFHQMLHNPVSSWRTTDIAQTYKEYLLHSDCNYFATKILLFANIGKKRKNYFQFFSLFQK